MTKSAAGLYDKRTSHHCARCIESVPLLPCVAALVDEKFGPGFAASGGMHVLPMP